MSDTSNNKGSASIVAILALMFFAIIGVATATLNISEVTTATRSRDDIAAQYLAESGAQWAITQIKSNPNFTKTDNIRSANKNVGTPTEGSYLVTVTGTPTNKVIRSEGNVNRSTRVVVLNVTPGGGSNSANVFNRAIFSAGTMTINQPQINGDIESNARIIVNSHTPNTVTGTAFCNLYTIYTQSAVTGKFRQLDTNGVLDVNSLMMNMPDISSNGIDLKTVYSSNQWGNILWNLTSGTYYYNGNYGMYNQRYSIPEGNSVVIYVNGDFDIGNQIIGDNITIYATGNINFNGGSIIGSNNARINIYSNKAISFNNGSAINGGIVTILANNADNSYNGVSFNGGSVNRTSENAISRVFVHGNVDLNDISVISGLGTGMLVATGNVGLNGGRAPSTVIIANGNVAGNSGSVVAGIYANGTLNMNGATASYNENVIRTLGIGGNTTQFTINSYNDH